jgi:hypothetical protein
LIDSVIGKQLLDWIRLGLESGAFLGFDANCEGFEILAENLFKQILSRRMKHRGAFLDNLLTRGKWPAARVVGAKLLAECAKEEKQIVLSTPPN